MKKIREASMIQELGMMVGVGALATMVWVGLLAALGM
tara:strand:+ start:62 stop:172 length:111 start_codon:yes stop_codon:yes gene_type:complete